MAVLKVYDAEQGWIPVGTNEAAGITTSNPKLLNDNESEKDLESIIIEMNNEITTIENNMNFIASQQGAMYWEEI